MKYTPAQIRKAIVGAVGFTLTVLAALLEGGLIPDQALPWVQTFIAVSFSYGIYKVRNDTVDGRHEAV